VSLIFNPLSWTILISFFSLDLLYHLFFTTFSLLFSGRLSFLSFLLAVFPLLSSFYLTLLPHLCLFSVSLPVLLSIIFLLSFHLVSFKSLSSPLAFYTYSIISLRLFTTYPQWFFASLNTVCTLYCTISLFFLLHPFFLFCLSSTRLVAVLPIHPHCSILFLSLLVFIYQLSSNYSVVSHGTPLPSPPIFCIIWMRNAGGRAGCQQQAAPSYFHI
jgi:hypothetical protein